MLLYDKGLVAVVPSCKQTVCLLRCALVPLPHRPVARSVSGGSCNGHDARAQRTSPSGGRAMQAVKYFTFLEPRRLLLHTGTSIPSLCYRRECRTWDAR